MKHFKRLVAVLLVGILTLSMLTACAGKATKRDYSDLTKAVNTKLAAKGHAAITEDAAISEKAQELADLEAQLNFVYNVTDETKLAQLESSNSALSEKYSNILVNLHKTYNGLDDCGNLWSCYDKSQDAIAEEIVTDLLRWEENSGLTVKSIGYGYAEECPLGIDQSDMTYPMYLYFFSAK